MSRVPDISNAGISHPRNRFHPQTASTFSEGLSIQTEGLLQNAVLMTEMAMELKDRCLTGEKYVAYLRNMTLRGGRTLATLKATAASILLQAQRLTLCAMNNAETMAVVDPDAFALKNLKIEYEKLLGVIERELNDAEEIEETAGSPSINSIAKTLDKIKYLEARQKVSDQNLPRTNSVKSVKSDVDEKYPENLSRESLIDLSKVVNLPTVQEDIFTSFNTKPLKTSSLSSLKNMRKVKLFLQRAFSGSDDDDDSSLEDEMPKMMSFQGDVDELKSTGAQCSPPKKALLRNIKEETLQE